MARYRKKPVEIEAVQLTWQTWNEVCELIGEFPSGMRRVYLERIGLLIPTLEGAMRANQDDWIIRGVNGELYPCKPDIFEKTYEKVE